MISPVYCLLLPSTTFSPLHIIYEGTLKEFVEKTFQVIQVQVSVLEFNKLG